MTNAEKAKEVNRLTDAGEKIYVACNKVGITLGTYYNYCDSDMIACRERRQLKRLNKKRDATLKTLSIIEAKINQRKSRT